MAAKIFSLVLWNLYSCAEILYWFWSNDDRHQGLVLLKGIINSYCWL